MGLINSSLLNFVHSRTINLSLLFGFLSLILLPQLCFGQNYNELFRQKKTQKKYLLNQIAALKVYAESVNEGYRIVQSGLHTIDEFSSSEHRLHKDFFNALKAVSQVVKKSPKVTDILAMQLTLMSSFNQIAGFDSLSPSDKALIAEIKNKVLTASNHDLSLLMDILHSGNFQMADSERLLIIDKLWHQMLARFEFVKNFIVEISLLSSNRIQLENGINKLIRAYGLD